MKLTIEQLQKFAEEINKEWIGYTSEVSPEVDMETGNVISENLCIMLYGEICLIMSDKGDFLYETDDYATDRIAGMISAI